MAHQVRAERGRHKPITQLVLEGRKRLATILRPTATVRYETTGHELIKTIHPHPTLSEAVMEAAAAAYDEVIHL